MRCSRKVLLALLAALSIAACSAGWWLAMRWRTATDADPAARLEQVLAEFFRDNPSVRNASLAVARGDGSFAWAGAAGTAQRGRAQPMAADTPVYIASVTKLYTATVVMMLAEQGRLALDDPIARYLPTALVGGLNTYDGKDWSGAITIRELLAHRSGIAEYYTEPGRDGGSLEEILQDQPERNWSADQAIARVRTELKAHSVPGTRTFYADTNYLLLGRIIEAVAHEPLARVYDDLLFRPLGLARTHLAADEASPGPPAAEVFRGDTDITRSRSSLVYGADGALVSTPREMIRFLVALKSGRLIHPASLAAMHAWHAWRFPIRYGLGTMEFRLPPVTARALGLPPLWGHSGSTGSFLYYCEERDLYVAGTIDQAEPKWKPFVLVRAALQALRSVAQ